MKSKRGNFAEKIINFLLNILIFIFGIILLISIYTGIQIKVFGNDYADFFGYSTFEVQTGSMANKINAGDLIVVRLTQKVKLNDIVTYKLSNDYITHRIIEVYNDTYVTKGDANNVKDEPINKNQIIGKVVNIFPGLGIFRNILSNPAVIISLIITLLLINLAFNKNKNQSSNSKKETADKTPISKKMSLFLRKFKRSKKAANNNKTIEKNDNVIKIENDLKSHDESLTIEDKDDELDKTMFFRVIPVNSSEINDTFLEIEKAKKKKRFSSLLPFIGKMISSGLNSIIRKISSSFQYITQKFKSKKKVEPVTEVVKPIIETAEPKAENEVLPDTIETPNINDPELEMPQEEAESPAAEVVPVDVTELDETLLEIAQNEIKVADQKEKNKGTVEELKVEQVDNSIEEDEDDVLTKMNLEMLEKIKNKKKGKNIIDTVMLIKEEELNELIDILIEDAKEPNGKTTIKDMFISAYIDARYYNYFGDKDTQYNGKNSISKIEKAIKEVALASVLINTYQSKDNKDDDMSDIYANIFVLIANLEHAKDSITDTKAKKEFYKKQIVKCYKDWDSRKIELAIEKIIDIQKSYTGVLECFFKNLETSMFELNFNKLSAKKDMYALTLEHNISFSKVYSDYIIDKTYSEGIVAEDKMAITLTLLLVQLVKDMILSNFNRKYILYIPSSLYTKEKKFEKILRLYDDKYAKDNVIILITFEDLLSNKRLIIKFKKMGYKFSLVLNKDTVIEVKDRGNLYIADYIFVDKKSPDMAKIISSMPEELLESIVDEDIVAKVGNFGSE